VQAPPGSALAGFGRRGAGGPRGDRRGIAYRGKYGTRAERYLLLEAGAVTENVCLQATALGLATVLVGSFDDALLSTALLLPDGEQPLGLMPLGAAPTAVAESRKEESPDDRSP
jgi:nitroreductase